MELSLSLSRVSGHGSRVTCLNTPLWHFWKAGQKFLSRAGIHWDLQAITFHENSIQSKKPCACQWKYFQVNKWRNAFLWKPLRYHFWQITATVMKSKHLSHRVMRSTLMHTGSKTADPQLTAESLLYLIRHISSDMQASNRLRRAEITNTNLFLSSLLRRGAVLRLKKQHFVSVGSAMSGCLLWGRWGRKLSSVLLHHIVWFGPLDNVKVNK